MATIDDDAAAGDDERDLPPRPERFEQPIDAIRPADDPDERHAEIVRRLAAGETAEAIAADLAIREMLSDQA